MARSSTTFQKGKPQPGPGRPSLDKSITAALRKAVDPKNIVELYTTALADDSLDLRLRLEVAERVTNRLEGTPIQSLRTQADDIPAIVLTRRGDKEATDV